MALRMFRVSKDRRLQRQFQSVVVLRFTVLDAPEPEVRHAGVERSALSRTGAIVYAVVIRAQEGSSLGYPLDGKGFVGIIGPASPFRVNGHARSGELLVIVDVIPDSGPLPNAAE